MSFWNDESIKSEARVDIPSSTGAQLDSPMLVIGSCVHRHPRAFDSEEPPVPAYVLSIRRQRIGSPYRRLEDAEFSSRMPHHPQNATLAA